MLYGRQAECVGVEVGSSGWRRQDGDVELPLEGMLEQGGAGGRSGGGGIEEGRWRCSQKEAERKQGCRTGQCDVVIS